ncbi:hypothetical protein [Microvirgula aerodenitrificans]|uniref:hypothetical protein n=1 Tax=Microvirgula aerodenitrificans TaxID=57480 RepID=UPI00248E4FCC|nr:hypothetical protein [Microvirgula aerodenitrificans]
MTARISTLAFASALDRAAVYVVQKVIDDTALRVAAVLDAEVQAFQYRLDYDMANILRAVNVDRGNRSVRFAIFNANTLGFWSFNLNGEIRSLPALFLDVPELLEAWNSGWNEAWKENQCCDLSHSLAR